MIQARGSFEVEKDLTPGDKAHARAAFERKHWITKEREIGIKTYHLIKNSGMGVTQHNCNRVMRVVMDFKALEEID